MPDYILNYYEYLFARYHNIIDYIDTLDMDIPDIDIEGYYLLYYYGCKFEDYILFDNNNFD